MEYKYFSPYKATYIFGFINSILLLTIYFIVSNIPCNCYYSLICDSEEKNYLNKRINICNLLYNERHYFDNIYSSFNLGDEIIPKIVFVFFYSILLGAFSLLINIVINNFTVLHIFLFELNKDYFQSILMYSIIYFYFEKQLGKKHTTNFIYISIFIIILIFILEIFIVLVFLEYIEFNCCDLNKNTKRNILKREKEESAKLNNEINDNNINDSFLSSEDDINN